MNTHRLNVPSRTACLIGSVALAVAILSQPVYAADVFWNNNLGGLWSFFPSNWSNGAINGPTASDDAVFDLGATYPVSFNVSPTNNQLRVRNDDVTFLLNGNTYTLTNNAFREGVRVGENADNVGQLTLINGGTLTTPGTVNVGVQGTGTLNIAGSTVESVFGLIGDNSTGIGTVNVLGASSQWNLTGLGVLAVGNVGTGTLNIDAGGEVNSVAATIGSFMSTLGGTGTVNVTNATWNNTGTFTLGIDGGALGQGTGTLNINTGGNVSGITTLHIGSTSEVNLKGGGTLTARTMEILGAFNFTQGTLNLTTGSGLTVGAGEMLGSTLSLQPGMVVNVTNGAGNVAAGGQLLISGSTASFSAVGGTNDGQISTINGSITYTAPVSNNASANISTIGATLTFNGDGTPTSLGGNNSDGLTNLGTLTLVDTIVNGDVHAPTGSIVNVAGNVTFNGLVSGGANLSGASTTTTFNGGYSPGDSPADVSIDGSVTLGASNTLYLELAGLTLGSEYDHIDIAGLLTVDGTLDIQLLNFNPELGQTFDLFDFGSIAGSFSNILLPTLSGNLSFDTSSLLTTGSISVIPEPTSAALLTLASLTIFTRRRSAQ